MKKVILIITVLFSILFGALPFASAVTIYTENWGSPNTSAFPAGPAGNGHLNTLGWVGVAQSQTAQPFLGIFASATANDPQQVGGLPSSVVFFTGLTGNFATNGPGMFYTVTESNVVTFGTNVLTPIDPTLYTNLTFNVEERNSGGNLTNYFAVRVGGSWYVATNNPLPVYTGPTGSSYTNWTMVYTNLASVWNNLTIDPSFTFVTIGATAGADLSGAITGIGIVELNNTNITGTPGFNYNQIVINQGAGDFPQNPATNTISAISPQTVYVGGGASFLPAFAGTPNLVFKWQTNGVTIANGGGKYIGATTTRLTITNASLNDAIPTYSAIATNNFPPAATNNGLTLVVNPVPDGYLYAETFPYLGSTTGSGNQPLNGANGVGWQTAIFGAGGNAGIFNNGGANGITFEFANVAATNVIYTMTNLDTGLSGLPFVPINPAISSNMTFQAAFSVGSGNILSMTVYWAVRMADPSGTNWYFSKSPVQVSGGYQTNQYAFSTVASNWNTLTITNNAVGMGGQAPSTLAGNIVGAGLVFVHTANSDMNFKDFAITTNAIPIAPPVIGTDYPIDISVPSGGGASFGVATVSGTPPYTYGWTTNGVPVSDGGRVSGSATATLTIANLTASDDQMQVIAYVTNSLGVSDHSDVYLGVPTTLTVTMPPVSLLYSEVFPFVGPVSGNYSMSSIGWAEAVPSAPFTVFRRGTAGTTTQGDGAVFAFLGNSNTTAYYATTVTDHNQSGLPFPNINVASYAGSLGFAVDIAPVSVPSNVLAYVTIQLNGANWYVAATALPVPTDTASGTYATYTMAFDPTAANWNNLTVNANNATIGAPAAGNLSGVMTGAGLVFATVRTGGTFDFDNFQITGTGVGGGLGGVNAGSVTGGTFNLSWVGNPAVNLQSTTNLSTPNWQDVVPSTLGLYSFPVSVTNQPQQFFRLVQH